MTGLSDLPTELLEHILDDLLQEHDRVSLKRCSLVNLHFRNLSQRRLLKSIALREHIEFGEESYYGSVLRLAEDIKRSPSISSYVHKFSIPCKWIIESISRCSPSDYQVLSKLLYDLPNLYFLSIPDPYTLRFRRDTGGLYEWKGTFDTAIQTTLLAFLRGSTKLTDLDLTGIRAFPVAFLEGMSSLKRLSVSTIHPSGTRDPLLVTTRSQLEYFRVIYPSSPNSRPSLLWLSSNLCPLEFQHLKTLKIAFNGREHLQDEKICNLCPEVPHIYIDLMGAPVYTTYNSLNYLLRPYPPDSTLDLNGFTGLKRMTIEGVLKIRTFHHRILIDYFETPIPWITNMLSIISSSSLSATTLTELTLKLVFIEFPMFLIQHLHNNWAALCSSLSTRFLPNFSRLILDINGLPPVMMNRLKEDESLVGMQTEDRLVYL